MSILGVLLFIGLVVVHEWGHFIVARRNGVEVEEFGLGFPPRAWGKKLKSGMMLSLNWLPLGGFVKLKGEHDNDERPGSLGAASLPAKARIMLAGVGANLLAGLVILTILAFIGLPQFISKDLYGQDQFAVASDTKVSRQETLAVYIAPGSPADKAGLKELDLIKSLSNGTQTIITNTPAQLAKATKTFAGQTVRLELEHNGQAQTEFVKLRSAAEVRLAPQKGYLGVESYELKFTRSTWSAPIVAVGFTKQLTVLTIKGLGHALGGLGSLIAGFITGNHQARVNGQTEASSQVGGPVAIFKILWGSGTLGVNYMLAIIAIISLTLALMNVLPIPALDGGRLFLVIFSRKVLKRPLDRAVEERIVGASMAVLIGLIILITIADVKRFF